VNVRGFGYAVGLGVGLAVLITVIAALHTLAAQLEGAMHVVIVFAEVAVCTILGAVVLGVLGLVAYRGQLARLHLAERRLGLEAQARELYAVRAEVVAPGAGAEALEGGAEAEQLEGRHKSPTPAILGKRPMTATSRHLEAVPDPGDGEGAS